MKKIKNKLPTQTIYYPLNILKDNVIFFVLVFFAVVALYVNTIDGKFLTADDMPGIVNNPMVKNFDASINSLELEKIYPAVIYQMFGMNPTAFHAISILLHFAAAVVVFVFIFVLFGKVEAVITTLIFVTHPMNSETVGWISAYSYMFYAILSLLILTSYTMWFKTKDKKYFAWTIGIYIFSMIFYRKAWVALIPVYVALLDQLILEKKINFKKIGLYMWFAVPTLVYLFTYVKGLLAFRKDALVTLYYNDPKTATPYLNRVLYTIFMTIKLFLWPIGLTIYHEGERAISVLVFTITSASTTVGLFVLLAFLFFKKGRDAQTTTLRKQIGGLILLIYSTMLLSFYTTVVVWAMAERYLYLASVFFGLIIALIYKKYAKSDTAKYLLVLLLLFYTGRTFIRTFDWKSSKSLWIATQKVSPYSYRVYNNLGDVAASEGNYQEAIKQFQTAIRISPGFADAVHNLGYTYYQLGDLEKAKYYLQKSYEINPRLYQALHKLGVIAFQQGDLKLSNQYFMQTLQIAPDFQPASEALKYLQALPPDYVVSTAPTR